MTERPWMKFYPSDWRADPALRMCSIGARGLWMEMLCLMHEANPRGALLVKDRAVSERQLASLAGITVDEATAFLNEMESAGVFSRDEEGTIFSRRMRRESERSAVGREHGLKGGNPALVKGNGVDGDKGISEATLKGRANPYIASSISTESPLVEDHPSGGSAREAVETEFSQTFWPAFPNKVGKPKALSAFRASRKRAGLEQIMAGLERYVLEKPPDRQWLNPATFLNQDRWNDQPADTEPNAKQPASTTILRSLARAVEKRAGLGEREAGADGQPQPDTSGTAGGGGPYLNLEIPAYLRRA